MPQLYFPPSFPETVLGDEGVDEGADEVGRVVIRIHQDHYQLDRVPVPWLVGGTQQLGQTAWVILVTGVYQP